MCVSGPLTTENSAYRKKFSGVVDWDKVCLCDPQDVLNSEEEATGQEESCLLSSSPGLAIHAVLTLNSALHRFLLSHSI